MMLLVFGIVLTIFVHELAHVLMATHLGWQFRGVGLNRKVIGVKVVAEDKAILASAWLVAFAGPLSNLVFADALFLLHTPTAIVLAYFNLIVAAINLLPIPGSDGTVIIKSLRGQLA